MTHDRKAVIKELGITDELYNELMECFVSQAEDSVKQLDKAVKKHNLKDIARLGHYVKGAAANIRLEDIRKIGEALEFLDAGANNAKDIAASKTAQLKKVLIDLRKVIGPKQPGN